MGGDRDIAYSTHTLIIYTSHTALSLSQYINARINHMRKLINMELMLHVDGLCNIYINQDFINRSNVKVMGVYNACAVITQHGRKSSLVVMVQNPPNKNCKDKQYKILYIMNLVVEIINCM